MPDPIRVLHVFSRLDRGGAETRTLELVRHVDRSQYRVDFCVLADQPGELEIQARQLGCEVHHPGLRRWGFSARFRRLLRQGQFDVLHAHLHLSSGLLLRLAAQCGTPVRIIHFRSTDDGRRSGPMRKAYRQLMRHWSDRYATHILAVSEWAMTRAWRPDWQSDPRCQVIYNGLDVSEFADQEAPLTVRQEFGIGDGVPLYVHVGRMTEAKNHLRLVDVFAALRQHQPEARLLLVGQGDRELEQRVRQRISVQSLDDAVILAGGRADVPRLLAAADAMIFPSRWEGLPGVVLEACAAGTPVVASDLPSIREIAARLPGVFCLPLATGDEIWTTTILQAVRAKRPTDQALHRFAESVFAMDRCLPAVCGVWAGHKRVTGEAA